VSRAELNKRPARRWGALAAGLLLALPVAALAQGTGTPGSSLPLVVAQGAGGTSYSVPIQTLLVFTALGVLPAVLLLMTAFTRIVIVLSLLRQALGTQAAPPNQVIIGLSLFLTFFVMQPVFEASWTQGIVPMTEGRMSELDGLAAAAQPFRMFMVANIREDDLILFMDLGGIQAVADPAQTPWRALIPAFIVGELKRAFEIGFLLFLPFLVIDMVIASILMSLGMMMLPPSVVALPFKLIFFVLVDGWRLVSGSLVQGFNLN
jgi:flagellar biosynthetic protein FliP